MHCILSICKELEEESSMAPTSTRYSALLPLLALHGMRVQSEKSDSSVHLSLIDVMRDNGS